MYNMKKILILIWVISFQDIFGQALNVAEKTSGQILGKVVNGQFIVLENNASEDSYKNVSENASENAYENASEKNSNGKFNNKLSSKFIPKKVYKKRQNKVGFSIGCTFLQFSFVYIYKEQINDNFYVGFLLNVGVAGDLIKLKMHDSFVNGIVALTLGMERKNVMIDFVIGTGLGVLLTYKHHQKFNFSIFIGWQSYELITYIDHSSCHFFDYFAIFFVLTNISFIFSWKVGE